jgi:hypothetical protein
MIRGYFARSGKAESDLHCTGDTIRAKRDRPEKSILYDPALTSINQIH